MTHVWRGIAMIMLMIAVAGCAAKKVANPVEAPARVVAVAPEAVVEAKPAAQEARDQPLMAGSVAVGDSVYFAPGASDIDSDGMTLIRRCADRLKSDERLRAILVGMTDDLGSRTYNVAIADRRIATVQLALRRLGVPAHQIKRRNMGGEMTGNRCADDDCRKLIRRVELHCGD
jgi:outer membrane protein OmpA-like peptidoglycan-associated protein